MKHVPRNNNFGQPRNYAFNKQTPPILEVDPGEKFSADLEDALNGILREDPSKFLPQDTQQYSSKVPAWSNPVCGPIYVRGVDAGDILVVTIERIEQISKGVICTLIGKHPFSGLRGWEECDEMYTGIIQNTSEKAFWRYQQHNYSWDLKPFIGTIATAPEWEVLSSLVTSFGSSPASGGNLDCRDIREGTKVYLQSFNKGGLLFFGDLHGSQGDGEVSGMANEVAGRVILSCNVIKNKRLRNVRLETPESLISIYCYRPVEEGIKEALKDLILWLEEDYRMTKREALLLMSISPEFKINVCQVTTGFGRLMTTIGAELSKKILPKATR